MTIRERVLRHLASAGLEPSVKSTDSDLLWLDTALQLPVAMGIDGDWVEITVMLIKVDEGDAGLLAQLVRHNHSLVFGRFELFNDGDTSWISLNHSLYGPTLDEPELTVALEAVAEAADSWYGWFSGRTGEKTAESEASLGASTIRRYLPDAFADNRGLLGISPGGVRLGRGDQMGQYQIEDVLGGGAFGTVYRARDLRLGRDIALKVLNPEHASTDEGRARFLREAKLAARVSHPFLVKLFGVGEDHGHLYIAYDFIDGPTLQKVLEDDSALEPQRASRLVGQLARALQSLHDAKVLHRDVKPANAIVWSPHTEDELVLLTDLGIAYDPDPEVPRLTRTSFGSPGTLGYLAPEGLSGPITAAGDQYSLAVTAYELLVGDIPFAEEVSTSGTLVEMKLTSEPVEPSRFIAGLSPAVDAVLLRALARYPEDRFETVAAFAHALDQAVSELDTPSSPVIRGSEGLAPYEAWESEHELSDPLYGPRRELADGLLDIVSVEGPMICERLFRIYLDGAGRSQLSEQIRKRLASALTDLRRQGVVYVENDWRTRNLLDRVVRTSNQPLVKLRELGPRALADLPPRELAASVEYIRGRGQPDLADDELITAVGRLYGRQRLSAQARGWIQWALDRYL